MEGYILIITMSILLASARAGTYDNMASLHTDLLSNYSKYIRPVSNQDNAVSVTFVYSMPYFREYDAIGGKFTVLASIYLGWMDEKLSWDPANYGNIYTTYFSASQVWTPNLILGNGVEGGTIPASTSVTVSNYGYSSALFTKIVTSACAPDITYYPYDIHNCNLSFTTLETYTVVNLELYTQAAFLEYTDNLFWTLSNTGMTKSIVSNYSSQIDIAYSLERRPTYLVYTVMLPVSLLNFVTLLAFVLPADSGERVSFATTMLLTLTMYMTIMSDSIPNTSDPVSILTVSLMVKLIISTLIVLSVIITLCVYNASEDKPIPQWIMMCCNLKRGKVEDEKSDVDVDISTSQSKKTVASWPVIGKRLDIVFFVLFSVVNVTETVVNIARISYRL